MTTQPELNLASKKPSVKGMDVCILADFLNYSGKWIPADILCLTSEMGIKNSESGRRKLRALAEASNGLIISGQKGYRHIAHATPDEINHAASWLEHQAKLMANRAQAIRRQAHKLVH